MNGHNFARNEMKMKKAIKVTQLQCFNITSAIAYGCPKNDSKKKISKYGAIYKNV